MNKIYMDHAATTPMRKEVLEQMYPVMSDLFGNPSSIHSFGREARSYLDRARSAIAHSIGAKEKEIIFTSGGTEADNLAIIGVARANQRKGKHLIISEQEHQATLYAAKYLEKEGFQVSYLPVYENGRVSIKDLENMLTDETILVSVMSVNNETGIIQPIREIGSLLEDHQAFFHTDAVQAFGLLDMNVNDFKIDLLTASSHKINGPKGVGFLYVQEDVNISSLHYGGQQERQKRPGTENIAGIVGFQKAVEIAVKSREMDYRRYQHLKHVFIQSLKDGGIYFHLNGDEHFAIPTILNMSFPGTNVEQMLTNLDLSGIAASSGSACTAGSVEPSHVLVGMFGKDHERTTNSIRFSLGLGHDEDEMREAARRVCEIVKRLTE